MDTGLKRVQTIEDSPHMATKSLLLVGISQNYKTVVTQQGKQVQTQHIYYTTQAINEGDMLNGKVIMAGINLVRLKRRGNGL